MNTTNEEELTPQEKWERATLSNNFIFYKVMHNHPDICKELLEILLEIKIEHIEIRQEDDVKIDYDKKGIRLDVYAVGSTTAYNIEMQSTNTGELPERSRFYQSVLDVDDLNEGCSYKDLRNSFIIFICVSDIFKQGFAKYTFENMCLEKTGFKLKDRTYKLFFIAENYDKILNEKQKAFLKLVMNNESSNDFSDRIAKLVDDAKHNTQWRKQFMYLEFEKRYSYQQGKNEGIQEQIIEDARSFYKNGVSIEIIAQSLKLPVEKIKEIVFETVN